MGYLDGAQSYWRHAGDYRNSTSLHAAGETPVCSTPSEVDGRYSTTLETEHVARLVAAHPKDTPLFIYVALHSVHGPNEDPFPLINVNATFPQIIEYERRIFAGMVLALDMAVANITHAFEQAGLWRDTVPRTLTFQPEHRSFPLPSSAVGPSHRRTPPSPFALTLTPLLKIGHRLLDRQWRDRLGE